jgi:hypothetical protein
MKKQILNEEFLRMQKLAGINEIEGMMGGMHGEDDFVKSILDIIHKKYSKLIADRDYNALGAAIEKDFPMLRSDLVIQDIFGNDTPE